MYLYIAILIVPLHCCVSCVQLLLFTFRDSIDNPVMIPISGVLAVSFSAMSIPPKHMWTCCVILFLNDGESIDICVNWANLPMPTSSFSIPSILLHKTKYHAEIQLRIGVLLLLLRWGLETTTHGINAGLDIWFANIRQPVWVGCRTRSICKYFGNINICDLSDMCIRK